MKKCGASKTPGEPADTPNKKPRSSVALQSSQRDLTSFFKLTEERLAGQLCRAIVVTIVENDEFTNFVQLLRPGLKLPDRKKLAGPILDTLYDEEISRVRENSQGTYFFSS